MDYDMGTLNLAVADERDTTPGSAAVGGSNNEHKYKVGKPKTAETSERDTMPGSAAAGGTHTNTKTQAANAEPTLRPTTGGPRRRGLGYTWLRHCRASMPGMLGVLGGCGDETEGLLRWPRQAAQDRLAPASLAPLGPLSGPLKAEHGIACCKSTSRLGRCIEQRATSQGLRPDSRRKQDGWSSSTAVQKHTGRHRQRYRGHA